MGEGNTANSLAYNDNAVLYNMAVTLSLVACVLCLISAFSTTFRISRLMAQSMVFQTLIGGAQVFCGLLLFESSVYLATGATKWLFHDQAMP